MSIHVPKVVASDMHTLLLLAKSAHISQFSNASTCCKNHNVNKCDKNAADCLFARRVVCPADERCPTRAAMAQGHWVDDGSTSEGRRRAFAPSKRRVAHGTQTGGTSEWRSIAAHGKRFVANAVRRVFSGKQMNLSRRQHKSAQVATKRRATDGATHQQQCRDA
jgi:hypothetical protein